MSVSRVGDIVWGRVKGHPMWPGQVMDPVKASSKAKKFWKPNTILISFFGDSSFGWFGRDVLLPFEENVDKLSKQKTTHKSFQKAIDEALEVLDRRAGRVPKTNHKPIDFLNPDSDSSEDDDEEDESPDPNIVVAKPSPATKEHVLLSSSADVLKWLQLTARDPLSTHMPKDSSSAAERVIFSLRVSQTVKDTAEAASQQSPAQQKALTHASKQPEKVEKDPHAGKKGVRKNVTVEKQADKEKLKKRKQSSASETAPMKKVKVERKGKVVEETPDKTKVEGVTEEAGKHIGGEGKQKTVRKKKVLSDDTLADAGDEAPLNKVPFVKMADGDVTLRSSLEELLQELRSVGRQPLHYLKSLHGAAIPMSLAVLRYREKAYGRSTYNRAMSRGEGSMVGDSLREATDQAAAMTTHKKQGQRRKAGVDVDVPEKGATAKYKEYTDKIGTWDDFMSDICDFFKERGSSFHIPMYEKKELDMYMFVKEVAAQGGYEAVTANRKWRAVAIAVRPDLQGQQPNSAVIRKLYTQHLLAYENKISHGCPTHEIELHSKAAAKAMLSSTPGKKAKKQSQGTANGTSSAPDVVDMEGLFPAVSEPSSDNDNSSDSDYNERVDKDVQLSRKSSDTKIRKGRTKTQLSGRKLKVSADTSSEQQQQSEDAASQGKPSRTTSGQRVLEKRAPSKEKIARAKGMERFKAVQQGQMKQILAKFDELYGPSDSDDGDREEAVRKPEGLSGKGSEESEYTKGEDRMRSASQRPPGPRKDTVVIRFDSGSPMPSKAQVAIYAKKYGEPREVRILSHAYMVIVHYYDEDAAADAYQQFKRRADVMFNQKRGSVYVELDVTRKSNKLRKQQSQEEANATSSGITASGRPNSMPTYLHRSGSSDMNRQHQPPPPPPRGNAGLGPSGGRPGGPRMFEGVPEDPRLRRMGVAATPAAPPPAIDPRKFNNVGPPMMMNTHTAEARPQFYNQQPPLVGPMIPSALAPAPPHNTAAQQQQPMSGGGTWRPHPPPHGPQMVSSQPINYMQGNMQPSHLAMQPTMLDPGAPGMPPMTMNVVPPQGPNQAPPPPAPPQTTDTQPLPFGNIDLMAILQNAGVQPMVADGPPHCMAPQQQPPNNQQPAFQAQQGQAGVLSQPNADIGNQLLSLLGQLNGNVNQ